MFIIRLRHNHPPIPDDSVTDGGYQLVGTGEKPNTVFNNSAIRSMQCKPAGGLQAVQRGHYNNYSSIFVSNLTTDTKSCDMIDFLFNKYQLRFKVISIPSKYSAYLCIDEYMSQTQINSNRNIVSNKWVCSKNALCDCWESL